MHADINIIDNYRKLPIGKYQDIRKIADGEGEELDKQVRIISVLTDLTEGEILRLPIPVFTELSRSASFLRGVCTDISPRLAKSYKIGKFELVPVTDTRKVTTAQYIDFQEFAKLGEDGLVGVLSCLLLPKGKTYCEGYDVAEVQEDIRQGLSVADVLSISAFFLTSYRRSIADMLTFSKAEAERIAERERREMMLQRIVELQTLLQSGGDGSQM